LVFFPSCLFPLIYINFTRLNKKKTFQNSWNRNVSSGSLKREKGNATGCNRCCFVFSLSLVLHWLVQRWFFFLSLSLFLEMIFFLFFFCFYRKRKKNICLLIEKKKGKTNLISKPFCLAAFPLPPSLSLLIHLLIFSFLWLEFCFGEMYRNRHNKMVAEKKGRWKEKKNPVNCKNCRKEEKSNKKKEKKFYIEKKNILKKK